MKTTKIDLRPQILSIFCSLSLITGCLFSCDVVEPDADILQPDVRVAENEIYVYGGNAAFIDLRSKVSTTQPVRFKVSSTPKQGTLADLGTGLLQYTPSASRSSNDAFEFTILSINDAIIAVDTVYISIEKDSTDLPCGIFPADDHVAGVRIDVPVVIPVLANDYICSPDSAELEVSLFRPDDNFPPFFGEVAVVGRAFTYTAGPQFAGTDKFIYKVQPRSQPGRASYGIVYLYGRDSCNFKLHNDVFRVSTDSLSVGSTLAVLSNDTLCLDPEQYSWRVPQQPLYGEVTFTGNRLKYRVNQGVDIGPSFSDRFFYEACDGAACKTARVDLTAKADSCLFTALPDTIDLSGNDIPLMYLGVLSNDTICDGYTTFEITQPPRFGKAHVSLEENAIAYERDHLQEKNDSLEYKICNRWTCSQAKVYIKRE